MTYLIMFALGWVIGVFVDDKNNKWYTQYYSI